jgi:hypothetical protein
MMVRVIVSSTMYAMKKSAGSILVGVVLLAGAVIVEAQQARKIPWIGYLAGAGSGPSRHLPRDCVISATSRARTLLLSIGRQKVKPSATPISPPS